MPEDPEQASSETVFPGRLLTVCVDQLRFADGHLAGREMIYHPGAVCMVPIDSEGLLLLVEQYRHGARRRLLELPAGTLEPGEKPAATAERELREEVGMRPGMVEAIGGFYVAPSYATEYIHLFLCSDLTPAPLPPDDDEDIVVRRLSREDALAAVDDGRILDAKSIAGILRWERLRGS